MPYSQKQWQDRIKDAQGNIIQEGTPFSAGNMNRVEQGIADAHAQLEEAARQKQTLIHGVSVLNGGVDAPVNIEIEGRTLIPMQNTVLDPLKYYVLADKKTKIKWADATIQQGIYKFTGKAERPTLIRVANFEGKVSGSTLENPHIFADLNAAGLQPPTATYYEAPSSSLISISKLDGVLRTLSTTENGKQATEKMSFDLIAEVERQLGRIPRATVADKVQWLKDNVSKITCNWHGFGSSPAGNKASLKVWLNASNVWSTTVATTANGTVTKLPLNTTAEHADANGFIHFLAYAEPSDGTTASTINTDYVELEIELKPDAILHAPRVPLYEVTKEHYDAINVTMLEDEVLRRYPSVEGVTHLQNPYVMAEGENLIPPFIEWGANHANSKVIASYELETNTPTQYAINSVTINALPNQTYTFSVDEQQVGSYFYGEEYDANNVRIGTSIFSTISQTGKQVKTFATSANVKTLKIGATNNATSGVFNYKNPMLTLGSAAKPFTPRNPSYALFETKLGSISGAADRLYEQDAKYFKRKVVEDVVLDGTLGWALSTDLGGYKRFTIITFVASYGIKPVDTTAVLINNRGVRLNGVANETTHNETVNTYHVGNTAFNMTVSDQDTGFAESYAPVPDEVKAYFNGWKVKTADGANKPTAWVSVVDGTDAPTQTLAYVSANKAPNYTPYKLSYILSTPKVEEIKSEGAISVNGLTQIEVGSGVIVREKAKVALSSGIYYMNTNAPSSFINRAARIIAVYKNGMNDSVNWNIVSTSPGTSFGTGRATIGESRYDTTAEYTATYIVYDRQLFTSNPVNVSALFASNVRSSLEDTVKKVEDVKTETSVNTNILYDVLKRLKAGGL